MPTASPGHPANRRLGDFEIAREIGRGGMGVVYEAWQVSLHRKVALKVLAAGLGLTSKAVERFHREAAAAARLHHTNIVPVYATGQHDGTHFYAMELIDGPSLDRVLRQARQTSTAHPPEAVTSSPPELVETAPHVRGSTATSPAPELSSSSLGSGSGYFDTVARMVADVADALEHAHKNGVIHRDIKPSNLLLSPDGRLSINDFGLARVLEQPGMTMTGEFVGTPAYMSPEQITAGRTPLDHRTDIYSLGATLYELLTLQPPFTGDRRDQLLAQILHKDPKSPRRVNKKVPVDLETICLKAMEKDPDRRYQSAGQMAKDLRHYVNRFAISARRAGPAARIRKWIRRNPALAAAFSAVLICAGAAGGLAYRSHMSELRRVEDRVNHERELLDERRRSALDKALLASRLEDFDGARQAIREAEQLGCSAGQIRMLRGQLDLYQGRLEEAIEHLTQAVELLPRSVAAWGMLAVAYNDTGRNTDYNRALAEAIRLPARTPEDYLFRGHAESKLDPDRALRSLDEAVHRRPSATLARIVRVDVLRLWALDTPDLERARQAMDDVRAIKQQFPDNAMVLSLSIYVHLSCYHVFGELRQSALREEALAEGLEDVRALRRTARALQFAWLRWLFLRETDRPDDGLDDLRLSCNSPTKNIGNVHYYGNHLYVCGDYREAAEVFELFRGEMLADIPRVLALAEPPGGYARAVELCREITARDLSHWDLFNSQLLLRFLGRKEEAVERSRAFLTRPDLFPAVRKEPFQRALEYCAERRSAEDLIMAMEGRRGDLCNAHLCIALTALADGDRTTARRHLELCIATRYYEFIPYELSRMLLALMDKDAAWPPWIPKKE